MVIVTFMYGTTVVLLASGVYLLTWPSTVTRTINRVIGTKLPPRFTEVIWWSGAVWTLVWIVIVLTNTHAVMTTR
jgi:hypothetical protein